MTQKQIIILVALAVFVVLVVGVGFLTRGFNKPVSSNLPESVQNLLNKNATGTMERAYSSQIPSGATPTKPLNSAPASSNPSLTTQIKFFDMKAAAGGFAPSSITVNKGDSLHVNLTAVDGDYDLALPYLGASFPVVKKGTTKELIFDTSLPGTFVFECQNFCPASGQIKGTLIVMSK